ncbi:hypothetical protein EV667_4212 [Ancylobacter aquaticus]|uniref:VWFA domain-containing protein n=1 Tax=Ancylobacter aquaticus TaxID=100 RepID=A0A4R1HCJ8_ANCAQ|nr:hypothetical protein [Ancylobacter aquaticus]TCK19754.1 hypothetical protein EV667_4212 [Ancylobacter aquaticus]
MRVSVKRFGLATAMTAMAAVYSPVVAQQADSASILIYDASGSMWGQLDGGLTKVEVARKVIGDFFASRDNSVPLGVIAYGHNRRGDCSDIETIANVGVNSPPDLSARLNRLTPRGMTPITDSLSLAASLIPPTAESADIILVTDGLETCDADPCALAAQLAKQGVAIRAHVVGFGLTSQEAAAMSCVADATGGLLLTPQTGQELADALDQIAQVQPSPKPERVVEEAFFDIGPNAEAGHIHAISYKGTVPADYYAGFTRRGNNAPPVSGAYGVVGGAGKSGRNPFSRVTPAEPGAYDLIMVGYNGDIIARQPIDVVPPSNGFDAVGSVEPGKRFELTWRGPNQLQQRIVIARPGAAPGDYLKSWGFPYTNRSSQRMRLTAPAEPGIYELRYISANRKEILFFRQFGVGVPFEDANLTTSSDLAAQAAAATQAKPGQDALPLVRASFRTAANLPQIPLSWSAVPLDSDMGPEAWSPVSAMVIGQGDFEPGRYEVSATGPGEVAFRAVVEILPGQNNDFVVPPVAASDDKASASTLSGPWQVIGVPPYQVQARTDQLLTLALEQAEPNGRIGGSWTAKEMLAGPEAAGREGTFTTAAREKDVLRMTFTVGDPIPRPMSLYLTPFGLGYAGSLSSGAKGMSVVMWPGDHKPPSLAEMRAAVHGPAPADFVDMAVQGSSAQTTGPTTAAAAVSVRLRTPLAVGKVGVQWSAVRTDVREMDVAFASHDLLSTFTTHLTPGGTYEVEGVNETARIRLAGTITINPAGGNNFEIPVAGTADDHEDPVAFHCTGTASGCPVNHASSGISLTLPNNWSMSEPFFYETAGGARANRPTATFFTEEAGKVISVELNPHQWMESNGPCRSIAANQLCIFGGQGRAAQSAFEGISSSLQLASSGPNDAATPRSSGSTGTIRLTFQPVTQFGAGCSLKAELANPSGEAFTVFAPINATANGQPVRPALNPDAPVVLEIDAYTEAGASLTPPTLMSPCDTLVVGVGPVKCRMGVGSSKPLTACPLPVEVMAIPEFTDLYLVSASDRASAAPPKGSPAVVSSSRAVIPVDLGGRDPEAVLRALFDNKARN